MTSAKVNATCWNVDSTTPGLIALCAVLVCPPHIFASIELRIAEPSYCTGTIRGFCRLFISESGWKDEDPILPRLCLVQEVA
jgi:hypothetical protein